MRKDVTGNSGTTDCSTAIKVLTLLRNTIEKEAGDDFDGDDFDGDDEYGPRCMSCGGEGIVDSVCEESGRWGWDDDGPGTCPNCNGSGLRKDQTYF